MAKFFFSGFSVDMRMHIVEPTAKFSYKIAGGSIKNRLGKSRELTEHVFEEIKNLKKGKPLVYVELADIRNIITKVMPENKPIIIRALKKSDYKSMEAGADYIYDGSDNIVGHLLELPLKKNRLKIPDIPTMLHEITHIFDKMLNPKIIARTTNLSGTLESGRFVGVQTENYNRLYDKLYPIKEESFSNAVEKDMLLQKREQEIREYLRNKKVRTKLNVLQNMRYQLGLELNAYSVENEFIDRMTPKGENLSFLKTDVDKYLFREKIDILKRITFEVIAKERKKMRKTILNNTIQIANNKKS